MVRQVTLLSLQLPRLVAPKARSLHALGLRRFVTSVREQLSFEEDIADPVCPDRSLTQMGYLRRLSVSSSLRYVPPCAPSADPHGPELLGLATPLIIEDPPLAMANESVEGLSRVRSVIAVTSCKGGVGKSTISYRLAQSLASMGAKVGLFDSDFYGPSLSVLSGVIPSIERPTRPYPTHTVNGVRLQSPSFLATRDQVMALRGSLATQRVRDVSAFVFDGAEQLLDNSDWGSLDFLLIDFPPGTGDIPLTLYQSYKFSGSLVVSTPQSLSLSDVKRGLQLQRQLGVPLLGIAENLSYFECEHHCRYHIFGESRVTDLSKEYRIPHIFSIPILLPLASESQAGASDAQSSELFRFIADTVDSSPLPRLQLVKDLIRRPFEPVPPNQTLNLKDGGLIVLKSISADSATAIPIKVPECFTLPSVRSLSSHASVRDSTTVPDRIVSKDLGATVHWANGSEEFFTYSDLMK